MTDRKIHKFDAEGKVMGRLASEIAILLRGKNKSEYQPNIDNGDIVEVVNISKTKFTGKKLEQKKYFRYSGYQGGLKETKMSTLQDTNPGEILRKAVRDMLPPTRLRPAMLKRLIIK